MHIVLFKSPRDVQQIDVAGKQLGLRNTLRTWYADATSIPYGHLMIDLSPKTIFYVTVPMLLHFCLNSIFRAVGQEKHKQMIKNLDYYSLKLFLTSSREISSEIVPKISLDFSVSVVKIYREISKLLRRLHSIGRKTLSESWFRKNFMYSSSFPTGFQKMILPFEHCWLRCIKKILRIDRTSKTINVY